MCTVRPEKNDARGAGETLSPRNAPWASAKEGSSGPPGQSLGATQLLCLPTLVGGSICVSKKELSGKLLHSTGSSARCSVMT